MAVASGQPHGVEFKADEISAFEPLAKHTPLSVSFDLYFAAKVIRQTEERPHGCAECSYRRQIPPDLVACRGESGATSYLILYLIISAFLMVAFISWVLTRAVRADSGIDATIILLLLGMMVAMLVGPAYLYLTTLSFGLGDVAIWEIAVFMMVGMMPIGVLLFAKYWMQGDPERKGPLPLSGLLEHVSGLRASYIILLLLSEFLMGWTFNLAYGLIHLSHGYSLQSLTMDLSYSLTTYWFVFTMVGEMALTLLVLRKVIRSSLLKVLIIQGLVMLLTPTALSWQVWETYTVYLEALLMTGLIVLALAHLRTKIEGDKPLTNYLGVFIIANAAMMAGFLLWLLNGDTFLLALSLVVETVIYFDAVLTGAGLGQSLRKAVPAPKQTIKP